jgi:hypothetical protein
LPSRFDEVPLGEVSPDQCCLGGFPQRLGRYRLMADIDGLCVTAEQPEPSAQFIQGMQPGLADPLAL